jgi:hypothetical protein
MVIYAATGVYLAVALLFITKLFDLYRLSMWLSCGHTLLVADEPDRKIFRLVAVQARRCDFVHLLLVLFARFRCTSSLL